jgi:redox-sensitive bicupin YhaK (pirin superfamily)
MQHQAQIYKADLRGLSESEVFRRLATFNFGDYNEASREPLGLLLALNDETLGAGNTIFRHLEENTDILILPLVGGVIFRDSLGTESTIGTGQIGIFSGAKGNAYQLTNPYKKELVNYMQIWIKGTKKFKPGSSQRDFDFLQRNVLIPIFGDADLPMHSKTSGFIGIYDGRKEGLYRLRNPENGLFVFVINGAFEFDNRLIESRDALAIANAESVEFEALSENGMLLVMEVPLYT